MTIDKPYYYMRLNEWHHSYLGIFMVIGSYFIPYELTAEIIRVIGWVLVVDDVIQHVWQGRFISKQRENPIIVRVIVDSDNSLYIHTPKGSTFGGRLPQFLIHTLAYKYLNINQYKWVQKVTEKFNKLFGAE